MKDKPLHLQQQYADQFKEDTVAVAYHARPPYPRETFDILISLIVPPECILELGAGTGDLTLELVKGLIASTLLNHRRR